MDVDICLKFSDNREVSLNVQDSLTGAQLVELVKSEAGGQKIILTCMGARLHPDKTLRELDVRSGYVFKVDLDSAHQITKIRQTAATIPKTAKFGRGYIIEQICRLAESQIATPLDLARFLLGESNKVYRVAGEAGKDEILNIFNLEEAAVPLRLKDDTSLHSIPDEILKNFKALEGAGYDRNNEQYCRLRAEFIMIPALVQARRSANVPLRSSTRRAPKRKRPTSITATIGDTDTEAPRQDLKMFQEYDLRAEVNHPVSGVPYVFSGRADWAAGHSGRGFSDSVLVCVEAKKRETFGNAELQLTAYLAICHHERKRANKSVPSVQGFSTDGQRYTFQLLTSDGTLHTSKTYDTVDEMDFEIVYNFIVHQVETAINLSPTSTPVKGSRTEKEEAVRTYAQDTYWEIFEPPPYCSDGEEEERPDLDLDTFALRERGMLK
ncbi:hypothetical protein V1525DRAFT_410607 [Lipomyces kononenkoae]|uniref:Uncharacterized protein n=1 Tax=Lipomyces kononenkoae TaxID=34357 RepID=A0ACC3SUB0_LIPKO